jgi:uncharacterized Tic20 family protein
MSQPHHAHPSQVPERQRLSGALTHLGGMFFLFIPSALVYFRTRRDPGDTWLAHQAKEALNFQMTVTALVCICGMLGWALSTLGLRVLPGVVAFDWLFSIVAVVRSLRGDRYVYPFKLTFVR